VSATINGLLVVSLNGGRKPFITTLRRERRKKREGERKSEKR
jgi:hypothetical protein